MKKLYNILLVVMLLLVGSGIVVSFAQTPSTQQPEKQRSAWAPVILPGKKKVEAQKAAAEQARREQAATNTTQETASKKGAANVTEERYRATDDTLPVQVKSYEVSDYDDLNKSYTFDLNDPDNIKTEVEYDPATGMYVVHTKLGDTDLATPFSLTSDEYSQYAMQQTMQNYWREKNGAGEQNNEKKFDITDMKFNIGPADKIFGPGGVQLKMQGSAEMKFGFSHTYTDNPAITQRARKSNVLDFDMKIQASVDAKVGDKLGFKLSYNTESSFDFDQQNLKLAYKGKEDDIIQTIEAGNVSMPLNSSLIQGSQSLFGVRGDFKFGKLSVQALVSQQRSESQTVNSQGGAQMTSFEIPADQYDDNRHFFLSHYFRDNYDHWMTQVPNVMSGIVIKRIEVWVTNKRGNYDNARNLVALTDLGEATDAHILGAWSPLGDVSAGNRPRNKANTLYETVKDDVRSFAGVSNYLTGLGMEGGEDFEKVESARLLSSSEYILNPTLGFLSLKSALNTDEVLAVAYEYTYGGQSFQVGEFSTDGISGADTTSTTTTGSYGNRQTMQAKSPLVVKLLKSTNNAPVEKAHAGTWDLLMKNVYSLGASQMQQDKFELYVMYKNDSVGAKVQYLPDTKIKGKQLVKVLGADRLDSKQKTNPDGKYDYVEGYTVLASMGRIILPVAEPFGSALRTAIGNNTQADRYVFQELYDSTNVVAAEMTEKNKYYLKGKYKGTAGNQISLGAMNVPRGSVVVKAGGATLVENVDYTVDYMMGTVTLINSAIIESGTNVSVSLENQSTFSMQRKSLFGVHAQYDFTPDLSLGATLMHLNERPLTTKVNTGSEPISNTIWGVNGNWKTNMQWLTNIIDKVPWIHATQPSTFTISGEFAQLIPGHTKEVSKAGYAYIDDFESTQTDIDIHYPNYWKLASTPYTGIDDKFNASATNDVKYGFGRSLLSWYNVDQVMVVPQRNTPKHLAADTKQLSDDRVRIVLEQEIFPYRDRLATDPAYLTVMNLSYYPKERGPYNLDVSHIDPSTGLFTNPKDRFGAIMRKIDNADFERANIEYIEFWLMDPMRTNPDSNFKGGELVFNLGEISEDILKDGKKSFENGIAVDGNDSQMETTVWGKVSRTTSTTVAFSNEAGARKKQDVGLNGLSTDEEKLFDTYVQFVNDLRTKVDATVLQKWADDDFSPLNDPATDNYHFYRGKTYDALSMSILDRYKHYNGTEGNSPATEDSDESYGTAATLEPDIEDINGDNTLNEYEKYYEYRVKISPDAMVVGQNFITNSITSEVKLKSGGTEQCTWYQFKIPIRSYNQRVGNIRNFKSIRFIRMYLTNFEDETHLRLGTLNLVRGEWRGYTKNLMPTGQTASSVGSMDVQSVNYEENSTKSPVNYVLPPGISRQTDPGQAQLIQQNEQALLLRVNSLAPDDARGVYKNLTFDLRNYKYLQMFVHAEQLTDESTEALRDGELTCFIRLGSDLQDNYYEYEIPLQLTSAGRYSNDKESDRLIVWPEANMFDFSLKSLVDAKSKRNQAKHQSGSGVSNMIPYVIFDDENGKPNNRITVMGNPTLGEVTTMMIGVRNRGTKAKSGEIWVNELRLKSYNEDGGWAATGQASLAISDIAQLNLSGSASTSGFGGIESNVQTRQMEDQYNLSFSAAVEAGRLLPEKAHIQLPFYYTYTHGKTSPKYNPLDTDVELKDALEEFNTKAEKDSLKDVSQSVMISKSYTVSNAKVDIKSKTPMFYDPANFTFSYNYTKQTAHDAETLKDEETTQSGSINYSFSFNPKPWEPFKNVKALSKPSTKWLKEFNIYYLPQSWTFNTNASRSFSQLRLRDFSADGSSTMEPSYSHDFMWSRDFNVRYDLAKSIKFTLQGATNATIEEAQYVPEIIDEYDLSRDYYERWKDTIRHSLRRWGSPYSYQQVFTAQWTVPFSKFRFLDWMTGTASYNATYNWNYNAPTSTMGDLGNTITSLRTWQADGQMNFEQLYNKSKYLKAINQKYGNRPPAKRNQKFTPKTYTETVSLKKNKATTISHKLNSTAITVVATDSAGRPVNIKSKAISPKEMSITSKSDADNVVLTFTTTDPNKTSGGKEAGDFFLRMLMMVRKASVTYRESYSLAVDGFMSTPSFMGQQKMEKNSLAPGVGFALGFFNKDKFMQKAGERGWLAHSDSVAKQATSAYTSDFNVKLNLEPIPGLKIDLTAQRYLANASQIDYMYAGMPETFTGSYNITQVALGTAFKKLGSVATNYHSDVYDKFIQYRDEMQGRLQQRYAGTRYGTTGFLSTNAALAGQPYDKSKGTVSRSSADVLIPAFLAAYTGRSLDKVGNSPFLSLKQMLPNWRVTFDGLTRIPWVKKHFQSITLTHAYTCKYSVGSYTSFSTWVAANDGSDRTLGFVRDVQTDMPTPSSAYDISSVSLTEQFMPLIGLNLTMKNSLSTKFEYKKQRNLALNINSAQMVESLSDEFVLGVGYTLKDFDMILKLKSDKQKKVKNDLKLQADFSYKDIKSLLRKIEEDVTQASSGNKVFGIKITADYTISSKINVQFYFERNATTPLISSSYPVRTTDFGLNLRFMLTR